MKKLNWMGVVCFMTLFSFVGWSYAENLIKPSRGEIGFYAGPLIGDTAREGFVDVGLDDSIIFGGRAAVNLNSVVAFEGMMELSPTDAIAKAGGSSATLDTFALFLHGNIVLHLMEIGRFVPYITGGIGIMHLTTDEAGVADETDFAFNFGGGGKIFLNDRIGLRIEGRDVNTKLEGASGRLDLFQITVGLSFFL